MWVTVEGNKVEIRGDPKLSRCVVSMKTMIKELQRGVLYGTKDVVFALSTCIRRGGRVGWDVKGLPRPVSRK